MLALWAQMMHAGGGGGSAWILATGFWADTGLWDDTAAWID